MENYMPCHRPGASGHALPKVDAGRRKAYRRKGYRVRIEAWHSNQLRWSVYRPRMQTSAVTGIALSVETAVEVANAWIAADAHGLRVT